MHVYQTQGFTGFAVKYSPFFDSRIAVAASANFGLVGNGRLFILGMDNHGIHAENWYDTKDCLYDTAWSEAHENQIVTACGDGSVKLFDISVTQFPIKSWREHHREVLSVSWNLVAKDTFATGSWDGTVKVWSPHRSTSLVTLPTNSCTYSTAFSPHSSSIISSVSSDSTYRVFDLRSPPSASNHLAVTIPIHSPPSATALSVGPNLNKVFEPSEALTHDWNKYRANVTAIGGVDHVVRTFDLRSPRGGPVVLLYGHDYAVRRLAWSPHVSDVLLTASYDMTCRIWSDGSSEGVDNSRHRWGFNVERGVPQELGRMTTHTEFVTGVDWCLFGAEGWCATCGWDEKLCVWDVQSAIGQ